MKTINKICFAVIATATIGLSGCMMDDPYNQRPSASTQTTTAQPAQQTAKATKAAAPVQKTSPGPKRAAAPTLPVIQ